MEITQVQIKPEDIETHIKQAVLNSAIGKSLEKGIAEKLRGWEFDKAVKSVIDEEIPKIIRNVMLEPDQKDRIAKVVRDALTDDLVLEIANKSIQHLWK